MKLKKILAGAVAAATAMTCLPQVAFADDGYYTSADGVWYCETENGPFHNGASGLWVYEYYGTDTNVVIPEEIDGKKVTGIIEGFKGSRNWETGTYDPAVNGNGEPIVSVTIPKTVRYLSGWGNSNDPFFVNTYLTSINVDKDNPYWTSVDGVLYTKDMNVLYHYPAGKSGTSYTVPDGVKCVESDAFAASSLTSISLPEGLVSFGWGVSTSGFGLGNVTSITIPATVANISAANKEDTPEGFTVKGYIGSAAEIAAKEADVPFIAVSDDIIGVILNDDTDDDGDCGIKLYSDSSVLHDYTLKATQTVDEPDHIAYDISLVDSEGNIVQLDGDVTVRMPYPSEWSNVSVYYVDDSGERTDLWGIATVVYNYNPYSIERFVYFLTNHFSTYGAEESEPEEEPEKDPATTTPEPTTTPSTTDPATTTAAPTTTTATNANADGSGAGNGTDNGEDENMNTGVTLLVIPAIVAAAGVIISKKRK